MDRLERVTVKENVMREKKEIAPHGQRSGNRAKGSSALVTNGKKFSYPGYNEILTGSGDPRVDSNDKRPALARQIFAARGHGELAVLDTFSGDEFVGNLLDCPCLPSHRQDFQAVVVVQVDVQR